MIVLAVGLAACTTGPAISTVTPTRASTATLAPTSAPAMTATALPAAPIPPTPTATREPPASNTRNKIQYTVKPGDALSVIAKQHGVSMAAIQLANDMDENSALLSGQKLEIPVGPTWEGESTFWIVHVVQVGESLTTLAQTYRVAPSDLIRVNGIADPSIVRLGSRLVIPLDGPYVAAAPPPAAPTRPATLPPATSTRSASAASPTLPGAAPTAASSTATPRPPSTLPTSTPGAALAPPEVVSWPNTVVGWINDRRAQNGLPRYVISPALMQAAQAHANDISARGYGSHVGSDGSDTRTRLVRAGYMPSNWGENWVQANTPEEAVNWWYNETPPNDPHRQNILSRVYLEVGIGVSRANNGFYFVADFGTK
jgi:uncharacterized protein YkwD